MIPRKLPLRFTTAMPGPPCWKAAHAALSWCVSGVTLGGFAFMIDATVAARGALSKRSMVTRPTSLSPSHTEATEAASYSLPIKRIHRSATVSPGVQTGTRVVAWRSAVRSSSPVESPAPISLVAVMWRSWHDPMRDKEAGQDGLTRARDWHGWLGSP